MKIKYYYILFLLVIFGCHSNQEQHNTLIKEIDPDIVIVNIEEGDRAFIADLLLKVDSCSPKVIAVDAFFAKPKSKYQDSVLLAALEKIDNEILAYREDENRDFVFSLPQFRKVALDEGLALVMLEKGMSSYQVPLRFENNRLYESFPLTIVKHYNKDKYLQYKKRITYNQQVPLLIKRTLTTIAHVNGSQLNYLNHHRLLREKIVIIGYIGPTEEDKHYTPVRTVLGIRKGPDTYGSVIIANQVRAILDETQM